MSTIRVHLPASLHRKLREVARRDGVSINQFMTTAIAEKLSAMLTAEYLEERAARGSRACFEEVLTRIPDHEPQAEDRL